MLQVNRLGSYKLNTIVVGDCLEVMREMPDGCVDLVVTDPPYFQPATHYQVRKVASRSLGDLSILETWFGMVFQELVRIVRPTGVLYVFCDGQSYPLVFTALYDNTKTVRPLIWDKVVSFNGYTWRHQHELIVFCERPQAPKIPTGDGDILRCRAVPINDRLHLAQKPVEIVKALIRKHEGIVLDPFIGSGTTAVAAEQLGRHWLGIDINPHYVEMALERIEGDRKKRAQLELF